MLSSPSAPPPLSADWRRPLWLALLIAASIVFSLGLACAAPLAAFAALAALSLPRREAFWFIGAVWLANQAVGYACLGYPVTANSLAWGVAIGVAAGLATLASLALAPRLAGASPVLGLASVFLAAFVVDQAAMLAAAVGGLGGVADFSPTIIGEVFALNLLAFVGLLAVNRLGAAIGLASGRARPLSLAG